ncbi:choice-of-anchor K domain-containing protein [Phenylobacterium sp.]|uniref:choice-of-anchor K domain-containing protein n=1 Tax=Phenylobacterium sp. TaxID=1871053 RepID=UPI0025F90DF8|nr:choice-of-anchor K domain-containing protein [Phenylobacterium sp.]
MHIRSAAAAAVLGVATLLSPLMTSAASADALYSGSVTGFFSDPVTSGDVVLISGASGFLNNGASAVSTGFPGAAVTWGSTPGSSQLIFLGDNFLNVTSMQIFHLGTIIYTNGTSDLSTLIFGAKLHLLTGGVADEHISDLNIVTTQNTGLGAARDSDFVGFSDFSSTFNVYEGMTSSIELFGSIVGDPMLTLDHIDISPVAASAGFIGHGLGAVPEPATWAMMILGFFGLGGALRTRRARAALA